MRGLKRRRLRRRGNSNVVEINLAAMLDMAFQLLAFFVLTFRPSAIEGHFHVHLPPPVPTTNVEAATEPSVGDDTAMMLANLEKFDLFVKADEQGRVAKVRVGMSSAIRGELTPQRLQQIDQQLKSLMAFDPTYTTVQCHADGHLLYGELMQIVGVCTQQVLPNGEYMRLNLIERNTNAAADSEN